MKNFSPALLAFLQNNTAYGVADLFSITYPQNLLRWSQDFSQNDWSVDSHTIRTANAGTDPLGGNTASQIQYTGGGVAGGFRAFASCFFPFPTGMPVVSSVWLMATSPVTVAIGQGFGPVTNVNVTTVWQRFSIVGTTNGVNFPALGIGSPSGVNTAFTILAWGAQAEMASTPGPYNPTRGAVAGAFGPRRPQIFATSWGADLAYAGNTYYSSQNGAWQRGKVTSEASFDLRANEMALTVLSPYNVLFPTAGVTLMAAALIGLFDAALVKAFTAYFPLNLSPAAISAFIASVGVENKYAGYIKPNGQISRSKIEFEVADPLYLLNLKMPRNLIQAGCRHTLFDVNCAIAAAPFFPGACPATVAAGSSRQSIITTASIGAAPPFFTQGLITLLTGFNAGLSFSIKQQLSTTSLQLANAMPLPLAIGDTFVALPGCDKTAATCSSKFGNLINFGGQPFVPSPEMAV
jgi:uncharacterized protein